MGNNHQKGITEIAFQKLNDDELMERKYSNPDSIIDYLCDNSNFRTLSSLIKETMINADICTENEEDKIFIDTLIDLLEKINPEYKGNDSVKKRVRRWINGEIESIESFDEAIEVCYALGLDIDNTNVFLNKCGFSSLSVRNAKHAVHYYCIINRKSLEDAQKLLTAYNNAGFTEAKKETPAVEQSQGSTTTVILWRGLLTDWESDDAFINSFLVPNKCNFIGYSNRALFNYFRIKNIFLTTIFIELAQSDRESVLKDGDIEQNFNQDNYLLQFKLRSAANKNAKKSNVEAFSELSDKILGKLKYTKIPAKAGSVTCQAITEDAIEAFSKMKKLAIDTSDIDLQITLSDLLTDIMTIEGTYKTVLKSLIGGKDGRIRPLKKDLLDEFAPVMKCFPTPKSFSKYEEKPQLVDSVLSARKILILMYFIIFCYEYVVYNYRSLKNYPEGTTYLFKDLKFSDFIKQTNSALVECSLSSLYPPNQFDCLILMNVRRFETTDEDEIYEPLGFFNEVLKLMFKFDNGMN